MDYTIYVLVCISLSIVLNALIKKNNSAIKKMTEVIKAREKMNKKRENWEKHHYRVRS